MPKWIWIVLAFILSTSIYFSIRYGLRPKPIPQLNPTVFETPEQVGIVTYRALRASLRQERVLVLGSSLVIAKYPEIWDGFVKAATEDHVKIDVVFAREGLVSPVTLAPEIVKKVKPEELGTEAFLNQVKSTYARGELALIYLMNDEATHLIAGTVTRKLSELPNLPVISISMLPMALREQEMEALVPHCLDPRSEDKPEEKLGCAAARISRRYLRKKLPTDKWVAAIERHGLKEYLLFVSAPQAPAPPATNP
jgi:hypothetical protein